MIIEVPNENSIVKWKNDEKDEWKVAEISDLIKAYERPQVTVFAENASKEEIEDFKQELENVLERPQDCSDCKRYDFPYFEVKFDKEQMQELVDKAKAEVLASIERSQSEWIPVSERLPEDRDWYLGQFKEPDTDFIGIPYICDYVGKITKGTTKEGWILRHCTDVDNASDYFRNLICVAWQPLPEPYKGGEQE